MKINRRSALQAIAATAVTAATAAGDTLLPYGSSNNLKLNIKLNTNLFSKYINLNQPIEKIFNDLYIANESQEDDFIYIGVFNSVEINGHKKELNTNYFNVPINNKLTIVLNRFGFEIVDISTNKTIMQSKYANQKMVTTDPIYSKVGQWTLFSSIGYNGQKIVRAPLGCRLVENYGTIHYFYAL